ncbi:MAG: DUF4188 domain-containing protein [Acidobacteriia bacterium]|nr:DUF4188 domain-containing protein [Terriglobia bacterium]
MPQRPRRETVDLAQYPDLVIIYLGMRVNTLAGIKTVLGFGPKINSAVAAKPDGLLLHENLFFSLRHVGMRQYWRDFDSLEAWSRSEPHRIWWQTFLKDRGGSGFWHETYLKRGGVEAVYIDMPAVGLGAFAPLEEATGTMFSARKRAARPGAAAATEAITEEELYRNETGGRGH